METCSHTPSVNKRARHFLSHETEAGWGRREVRTGENNTYHGQSLWPSGGLPEQGMRERGRERESGRETQVSVVPLQADLQSLVTATSVLIITRHVSIISHTHTHTHTQHTNAGPHTHTDQRLPLALWLWRPLCPRGPLETGGDASWLIQGHFVLFGLFLEGGGANSRSKSHMQWCRSSETWRLLWAAARRSVSPSSIRMKALSDVHGGSSWGLQH